MASLIFGCATRSRTMWNAQVLKMEMKCIKAKKKNLFKGIVFTVFTYQDVTQNGYKL